METVHRFDDDPDGWNRNYVLNFVRALPGEAMQRKALAAFVANGLIGEGDAAAFVFGA